MVKTELLTLLQGDCIEKMAEIPDGFIQACVTSPPYFGLRAYQGGSAEIGSERTWEDYVQALVSTFSRVRRVLRDDGCAWLNLGDCYATGAGSVGDCPGGGAQGEKWAGIGPMTQANRMPQREYKPKDLMGIPWRVAFALQADGWYLRSCNIWAKPNGMPESVKDRPVTAHEYVFQLTKSEKYFFDYDAVRLPAMDSSIQRLAQHIDAQHGSERANAGGKVNGTTKAVTYGGGPTWEERKASGELMRHGISQKCPAINRKTNKQRGHSRRHEGFNDRWDQMEKDEQQAGGAALRSVWWIPPAQSSDNHFAVMPERLAALCILASTKPGDMVLDPFGGSGTVGKVAIEMGRNATLIELNPDYCEIIRKRCRTTPGLGI